MSYRIIELSWGDNEVSVPVDMDLLEYVTNKIGSPFTLGAKIYLGDYPDYTICSKLISVILSRGGVKVDPMEVWNTLTTKENFKKTQDVTNQILDALCPKWEGEIPSDKEAAELSEKMKAQKS